jgi:hypothetical protein
MPSWSLAAQKPCRMAQTRAYLQSSSLHTMVCAPLRLQFRSMEIRAVECYPYRRVMAGAQTGMDVPDAVIWRSSESADAWRVTGDSQDVASVQTPPKTNWHSNTIAEEPEDEDAAAAGNRPQVLSASACQQVAHRLGCFTAFTPVPGRPPHSSPCLSPMSSPLQHCLA